MFNFFCCMRTCMTFLMDHRIDQSESHIWHINRKWNTAEYFPLTEWRRYRCVALSQWWHWRATAGVPWNGPEGPPPGLKKEGGMEPHHYRPETFISVQSDTCNEQARSRGKKLAKIYCQVLLQKTCTCGILKLKIVCFLQSSPLLVFVTVNGETVAHLQVSIVSLV